MTGIIASSAAHRPILDTIKRLHAMDFWLEIVTLLIPGFNDSPELTRLTEFLGARRTSRGITAFHSDYKMMSPPTRRQNAAGAVDRPAFRPASVYGKSSGRVGDLENTLRAMGTRSSCWAPGSAIASPTGAVRHAVRQSGRWDALRH